jgi:nucleoside-diphosphate-sugar epimerase
MMTDAPLFDPAEFRIPEGVAHVCAGGETPFLRRHDAALLAYARDKSLGEPGREAQEAQVARARDLLAAAWGVAREEIGFVAQTPLEEGLRRLVAWWASERVHRDGARSPAGGEHRARKASLAALGGTA